MIELTSLEVYRSIFNKTGEIYKFELHSFPDEKSGVSFIKVRDETERELDILDITATNLQDEIIGPIINDK